MKPIVLTSADDKTLSVSPFHLIAWGNKTGGSGGFIVITGAAGPKDVLETRRDIDRLFEEATAGAVTNSVTLAISAAALVRAQEDAQG